MKQSNRKYAKVVLNLLIAGMILLFSVVLLPKVLVFFSPFLFGWIIAVIASPLVRFFEEKFRIRRKAGTVVVIIAVIGLVVTGVYFVGTKLAEQAVGLIAALPVMWQSAEQDFAEIGKNLQVFYERLPGNVVETINSVGEQVNRIGGELIGSISTPTITAVGNFARQLPSIIIGIIMGLLSSYFFIAEKDYVTKTIREHTPDSILYRWDLMKRSLKRAVGGYFKAQLKIEVWMYLLLLIGLSVLGIDYAILIALGIAVLDFLPFFGTGAVLIPWAIVKFLSGDYKMTIGFLIIWGGGQLARQVIQPKIVGDSVGMPSIPTLFLLYIGYKAAGVLGMIFAVPIGIILQNMYQEGLFETTINSLKIVVNGINSFRKLTPEDLEGIPQRKKGSTEQNRKKESAEV